MKQLKQCSIRLADASDLERVWLWRNDPTIKAYMFNSKEIPWAEHVDWFERTLDDNRKHTLIFELEGLPAGFATLHVFAHGKVAEWGFYKAPDAPGGTGKMLGVATLHYAFEVLNLHKIYAQVLVFNKRSIDMHFALGFVKEGVLKDQHFDGRAYYDVCCFGIKKAEWVNALLHTGLKL